MYRFTIPKDKLEDFMIMLMFDKMFDDNFMGDDSKFEHIFDQMESAGFKSKLFSEYFNVDSFIRSRYRRFKDEFTKENNSVNIQLIDVDNEEGEE